MNLTCLLDIFFTNCHHLLKNTVQCCIWFGPWICSHKTIRITTIQQNQAGQTIDLFPFSVSHVGHKNMLHEFCLKSLEVSFWTALYNPKVNAQLCSTGKKHLMFPVESHSKLIFQLSFHSSMEADQHCLDFV